MERASSKNIFPVGVNSTCLLVPVSYTHLDVYKRQIIENTFKSKVNYKEKEKSSIAIIDESKCIKCGRCIAVCRNKQGIDVLCYANRAEDYKITTAFDKDLNDISCISCGQCSKVCPVGAIIQGKKI